MRLTLKLGRLVFEIIIYIMVLVMLIGAVDKCIGGKLGLSEKFEEGMKIAKQCNTILEDSEKKITILLEKDGELKEENFEANE